MTTPIAGGKRRIDRVLDDAFVTGLEELSLEELRSRREDADQEETDLSYLRRLLQGRLDIVLALQSGETAPAPEASGKPETDAELVARLTLILSEGGNRGPAVGMGRHQITEPSRVGETRRADESLVADVELDDPATLSPEDLEEALERLRDSEHRVSEARKKVQGVIDALGQELARRYRDGVADISSLLTQ